MQDMAKPRVLVLCTGNSCRSQMAEGWIRYLSDGQINVYSAGIEAHGLNERAVACMQEAGVDISGHRSELIDNYQDETFDVVLTVCDSANESCPILPGAHRTIHHSFPDPAGAKGSEAAIMAEFRSVRDEIKRFSEGLVKDLLS